MGGSSSAFVVAAVLHDDRGKAAQIVPQHQRQPGSIQVLRLLRRAATLLYAEPWIDARVGTYVPCEPGCILTAHQARQSDFVAAFSGLATERVRTKPNRTIGFA
jgi:hypothetical protein